MKHWMQHRIRQAVFGLFMGILILPALQFKLNLIPLRPLAGTYVYAERPSINRKDWESGEYQKKYGMYINDHMGMREIFVRSYNQVWFSLFGLLHAQQVVMGKNSTLFELNYIRDYTGTNFRGEAEIDEQLRKVRFLQDTLDKQHVKLLLYFAPGKASYFPERIPQKYLDSLRSQSNYRYYTRRCKEAGLRYFDMNAWFVSQKGKSDFPLFARGGIHWSTYGMLLALDSLAKFMGPIQGAPLPRMMMGEVELSDTARDNDNDIERGLNLLFDLPHEPYAYPAFTFSSTGATKKPKVMVVADSYWWSVFGSGNTAHVFDGSSFWYYNAQVYYDNGSPMAGAETLNIAEEVKKVDFVIILSTEANLYNFGWGFIEKLYDQYQPGNAK